MECQLTEGVCLQATEAENIYEQLQQKNETVKLSGDFGSGQTQVAICGQPGGDAQPNQAMQCLVVKKNLLESNYFFEY